MNIQEKLLLYLSREPESDDFVTDSGKWTIDNALSLLENEFFDFLKIVSGKSIVDFGCGEGYQCIALAKNYDCTVVGIDTNKNALTSARKLASQYGLLNSKIFFQETITTEILQSFDIVISQNSFEHFPDPSMIMSGMRSLINKYGKIIITFGPPWFSPYGSHMHFFCKVPWINVVFSEKTVMNVRTHFRNDGALRYEDVESGLNKMTISKFEGIVTSNNLKIDYKKYKCVRSIHFLSKIPFFREFFINRVSVILSRRKQ